MDLVVWFWVSVASHHYATETSQFRSPAPISVLQSGFSCLPVRSMRACTKAKVRAQIVSLILQQDHFKENNWNCFPEILLGNLICKNSCLGSAHLKEIPERLLASLTVILLISCYRRGQHRLLPTWHHKPLRRDHLSQTVRSLWNESHTPACQLVAPSRKS